jgi:ribosome recycling factor
MAYDFKPLDKRIKEVDERLAHDLGGIRTGRAAPAILDGIQVESYGTRMSLNQLASITAEDARTLRIAPYDASQAKEIEKAITVANLGVSVGMDERGVRVSFPELTSERRVGLVKFAKEKLEEARTALRHARDEVWGDIQKRERQGDMPEDDKFRAKDEMQKRVDVANKKFDDALARKDKEIHS